MTSTKTRVDFWFDPSCPWAWMTSRWVDEVATQRDLDITWHIMSLAILNENNEVSDSYRDFFPRALRYARVVATAELLHGPENTKALYDALGKRIHLEQRATEVEEVVAEALAEAGLPASIADRALPNEAGEFEFEKELRESHGSGMALVGNDVGTPILSIDGVAFFGPVISPAPKGEQALKLWDGVVAAASFEGFFELKRSRTVGPIFA